jgi:hypothetical protein
MAGHTLLRIGQHGKVVREYLGGGVWLAGTRFRDADGVTRRVRRLAAFRQVIWPQGSARIVAPACQLARLRRVVVLLVRSR